jgi:hypothetical protein
MRKQQIEATALDVAVQVRVVEEAIEAALMEIADLQGRMIRARAVAGVATATGHGALAHMGTALTGLIAARGGMAECHVALVEAKKSVPGLRTVSFGDGTDCPPTNGVEAIPLRVVA